MRNLDVERLASRADSKIVTHADWIVAALLALNACASNQHKLDASSNKTKIEKSLVKLGSQCEDDAKIDVLPTGDSSNVISSTS